MEATFPDAPSWSPARPDPIEPLPPPPMTPLIPGELFSEPGSHTLNAGRRSTHPGGGQPVTGRCRWAPTFHFPF